MKIDRVTIDPHPAVSPANAEKLIRDEKGTLTTDAVSFEGERNEREQQFQKKTDEGETDQENQQQESVRSKIPAPGKRLIDVVV